MPIRGEFGWASTDLVLIVDSGSTRFCKTQPTSIAAVEKAVVTGSVVINLLKIQPLNISRSLETVDNSASGSLHSYYSPKYLDFPFIQSPLHGLKLP